MADLLARQPVGHRQHSLSRRGKGAHLFAHLSAEQGQHETGHDRLFVDIQARTPSKEHWHPSFPCCSTHVRRESSEVRSRLVDRSEFATKADPGANSDLSTSL